MSAAITPTNATNKAVTWSVINGTGTATISSTGLLTATGAGTVTVKATAQDGSNIVGTLVVTVEAAPVEKAGTWKATGNTGFNTVDGKAYVFQEFELLVDGERISLHKDNIKSITSNGKALTPNTDHTLWFNVLAEAGEREFVVVDKNDVTYKATLNWTAPAEVTATAEGAPIYNESLGATYQKYNVEGVNLVEFDAMYQIKPVSGNISELKPSGDNCLWFKVDADEESWAQEEGDHIFLVKHGETWSKFVVNVVEDPEEPTEANFISTGDVGIAPESAGDAAGKIYAEYKLVANEKDISLASDNVEYIKVKVGEGEWKDLTANTDATLWFNVESEKGVNTFEVKTKDGNVYTATLDWDKEIKTATWVSTEREGTRPGTEDTYVEYKLMDGDKQVSLKVGVAKLFASKQDGKWVSHELNTDETLWLKKDVSGTFTYFIVAKDNVMYKTTLEYEAPAEPVDETDPEIKSATVEKNENGDLVLTVEASDENLYSLEVDHSHGKHGKWSQANLPEFTVYADPSNPWGTSEAKTQFETAGVTVDYDADTQTWTITFKSDGQAMDVINDEDISNGAIEFYLVAHDKAGNSSGSMYDQTYEKVVYTPDNGQDD